MENISLEKESKLVVCLRRLFPYFVILSGVLLLLLQSLFAPGAGKAPSWDDSSIYNYVGWLMNQGFTPYIDIRDSKGPVFYFMEMLGIYGGTLSLWVFEGILLFIAFLFCYKMFKMHVNKNIAIFSTLFIIISTVFIFDRGNMVEEFALPFCFIALYILAKYPLQNYSLKIHQILILGGTFGAVLLMRPNIPMLWLAFCFVILVHSIIIKKYKRLLIYPLTFILGVAIIMLPFIIYLVANGALAAYIDRTMFIKSGFVPCR
ncbi:hypothetical protein AZF37_01365 [endosymbiont 'TC1' of Trimyema compressum]|uniref:hypothetical protein n=1 Tax=endosymbiont 'TC1' of Trimyema compressum TaxID=243899 RepID=UPI0007F10FEE|nr:hypothetical protein [endosymbiont 'TC1' of Trimyema compressum]AMP20003.1 hypothetical protein AZF37_01365 [endosymbiont 'TC1' of Trimyema compressum]